MAVIGAAEVVIRAITAGLQSDIERGLNKGIDDAGVDAKGEDTGKRIVEGAGKGIEKNSDKLEKPLTKVADDAGKKGGNHLLTSLFKAFSDDSSVDKNTKSFSKKLEKSLTTALGGLKLPPIAWLAILATPALAGAAKIISQYIIGIVGQIGFLTEAAIGGGAAVGGAFAGLVTAIAPLFLLLKKQTPVLAAFKEEFSKVGKLFDPLAESIQLTVLPAVLDLAKGLTFALLPSISDLAKRSAQSFTTFLNFAGAILTSTENVQNLNVFFAASSKIFDDLLSIVAKLVGALIPFLAAVAPLAVQFADAVARVVGHWLDLLRVGSQSGTLAKTLGDWYQRARQVFNALGDIVVGIFNILKIGGNTSVPFFDSLSAISEKFRDFTESTKGKLQIQTIFENALPVMHEVNLIIGDIVKAFATPLLTGNNSNIIAVMEIFRTKILPTLIQIGSTLTKQLSNSLVDFASALADFLDSAANSGALGTFFQVLEDVLRILTIILKLPGASTFIATLFGIAAGLGALNFVTLGFSSKALAGIVKLLLEMTGLTPALAGLGPALESVAAGELSFSTAILPLEAALAPLILALGALALAVTEFVIVWKNWDTIIGVLDRLPLPLRIFAAALGLTLSPIIALVAILKNKDAILNFFKELPGAIGNFLSKIPGALGALPGIIGDAFNKAVDKAGEFLSNIGSKLGDIGSTVIKALAGFGEAVFNGIVQGIANAPDAGKAVLDFIQHGIEDGLPKLAHFLGTLPFKIIQFILQDVGTLIVIGARIIQFIVNGLVAALPTVLTFFATLPFKILTAMINIAQVLIPAGARLIASIVTGLVQALPGIINFFLDLPFKILQTVVNLATTLGPIGFNIISGILTGLLNATPGILEFFGVTLPNAIFGALVDAGKWLLGVGAATFGGFLSGIVDGAEGLWQFLRTLPFTIITFFANAGVWLLQVGKDIIQGLLNGITATWQAIIDFFTGMPHFFVSFFKGAITWLENVGEDIVNGLINGIKAAIGGVGKAIGGILSHIPGASLLKNVPGLGFLGMMAPASRQAGLATGLAMEQAIGPAIAGAPIVPTMVTPATHASMMAAGVPSPFAAATTSTVPTSTTTTTKTTTGDTTLVRIENATFNEKTDIDALLGPIRLAYARAGGR